MLPEWEIIYVLNKEPKNKLTIYVYAENPFQAYYNGMSLIQIKHKTKEFAIKKVEPKR